MTDPLLLGPLIANNQGLMQILNATFASKLQKMLLLLIVDIYFGKNVV